MANRDRKQLEERQERTVSRISQFIVLIIGIFVLFMALFMYKRNKDLESSISATKVEYSKLNDRYKNLKPTVNKLSEGKIDMQSRMDNLTQTYELLMNALFGGHVSKATIKKAEPQFKRYFGVEGYGKLKALSDNLTTAKMVSDQKVNTLVTYSDVDTKDYTMKIAVFTKLKIKEPTDLKAKSQIVMVSLKYDLETDSVSNANVVYATGDIQ